MKTPPTIALTGASGFVGQNLIKALSTAGYKIRALQNRGAIATGTNIEIIQGNLNDKAALARLLKDADTIIHCAALVAARKKQDFHDVNVTGTHNLVDAAKTAGINRILLLSSLAAREPHLSPYAHSKRESEKILEQSNLNWDAFRPPAIYGPGDLQMLKLFKLLKSGIALTPAGPAAKASMLYIDDLTAAILAWVKTDQTTQTIFEIASPPHKDESWGELLTAAAKTLNTEIRFITPPRAALGTIATLAESTCAIRRKPVFTSHGKIAELCHPDWTCNVSPLQSTLNWTPTVTFEDGIAKTLQWYKDNNHI